jgi:hypothetical protein
VFSSCFLNARDDISIVASIGAFRFLGGLAVRLRLATTGSSSRSRFKDIANYLKLIDTIVFVKSRHVNRLQVIAK